MDDVPLETVFRVVFHIRIAAPVFIEYLSERRLRVATSFFSFMFLLEEIHVRIKVYFMCYFCPSFEQLLTMILERVERTDGTDVD